LRHENPCKTRGSRSRQTVTARVGERRRAQSKPGPLLPTQRSKHPVDPSAASHATQPRRRSWPQSLVCCEARGRDRSPPVQLPIRRSSWGRHNLYVSQAGGTSRRRASARLYGSPAAFCRPPPFPRFHAMNTNRANAPRTSICACEERQRSGDLFPRNGNHGRMLLKNIKGRR
jgi:hypothetical protein